MTAVRIRPATIADAEATLEIYNAEVVGSDVTFDLVPRTIGAQREWLDERSGALEVVVASLSTYRERAAYRGTVEDSVYVHGDFRGEGVGRALLHGIVEVASSRGFHTVIGRVVGGHDASIALHRAEGFELVGVEREVGRKFGRWLDVVVMQKLL